MGARASAPGRPCPGGLPFGPPAPRADRSIYLRDPAGNLVEVWDSFEAGKGAREGADGLTEAS